MKVSLLATILTVRESLLLKMADAMREVSKMAKSMVKVLWCSQTETSTSASGLTMSRTAWASFSHNKRELSDKDSGKTANAQRGSPR